MPDYSDIDPASLKPYERRRYIAWRVLGSPGKVVQKELALELGVSETTISHDMDSEEYLAAAGDVFREMVKKHLLPQAILNVARHMGKEAKSDKKPEVSIEMLKQFGHLFVPPARLQVEDVTERRASPSEAIDDEIQQAVDDHFHSLDLVPLELPIPEPGGNGNGNGASTGNEVEDDPD